jgi:hypothetical protein
MNLMMILALLSTFIFAGPPPQRTPDNDLVADLVAATNDCLRKSITPTTPDDERVWTWSCIQLAFRSMYGSCRTLQEKSAIRSAWTVGWCKKR